METKLADVVKKFIVEFETTGNMDITILREAVRDTSNYVTPYNMNQLPNQNTRIGDNK